MTRPVVIERDIRPPQGIPRPVPRPRLIVIDDSELPCPDGCGARVAKSDLYAHRFRCPKREGVTG